MSLFLASTSPYRRELLSRLGLPFQSIDPQLDEEPFKKLGLSPRDLTARLAREKCAAGWNRLDSGAPGSDADRVVIGSDQVVSADGDILGKPGDRDAACRQLARLAGRTHELVTAFCVQSKTATLVEVDVARLTMLPLSGEAIARYVDHDRAWDCAGSYKIEQMGIVLFDRVEAADFTAIQGLPLMAVAQALRAVGQVIP